MVFVDRSLGCFAKARNDGYAFRGVNLNLGEKSDLGAV